MKEAGQEIRSLFLSAPPRYIPSISFTENETIPGLGRKAARGSGQGMKYC